MEIDLRWLDEQVKAYKAVESTYREFAECLDKIFHHAARAEGISAIIQVRAKAVLSFAEKCIRKRDKYTDPVRQLTDLCGGRIIVESMDRMGPVFDYIRENFDIDEANTEDAAARLKSGEFGYRSYHFIVSFKAEGNYFGVDIPGPLFLKNPDGGSAYKAEIQVRTMLAHVWATLIHDTLYKSAFRTPRHLERKASRISAELEASDRSFLRLLEAVRSYRSTFGAFMLKDKIENEIKIKETVKKYEQGNDAHLAHQIARLAMAGEDWKKASDLLAPHRDQDDSDVIRDLGISLCNQGKKDEGKACLIRAADLNPQDADTLCELGDLCLADHLDREALSYYETAFNRAPAYPRVLRKFIWLKLKTNPSIEFLTLLKPTMEEAIRVSQRWIQAEVHIPWAYYDIGFFSLLLEQPYQSLSAYGKAILTSASVTPMENACNRVEELIESLKDRSGKLPEWMEWIRRFLLVGATGKAMRLDPKHKPLPRHFVKQRADGPGMPFDSSRPVVIVAGGCDSRVAEKIETYGPVLEYGFQGFRGTVISGGTTSGISKLVGDLPNPHNEITKIAYLPKYIPAQDEKHDAYTIRVVQEDASDYTPLQPLQVWIDLIVSGISPNQVKIIGINGGPLSAFEYRLGLVMGAAVGIIRDSGREANKILEDPDWQSTPGLLFLPVDKETLRAFISPAGPARSINEADREMLARNAHESHRKNRQQAFLPSEPNLAEWDQLPDYLKASNYRQIDHIEAKLNRVGLKLRKVPEEKRRGMKIFKFDHEKHTQPLAEMEHGRWNLERLLDGWRLGHRDPANKISPYLIGWEELTEEVKQWDRNTVKDLPQRLAALGYEIYDPENASGCFPASGASKSD